MDLLTALAAGGVLIGAIAVQLALIVLWGRLRGRRERDVEEPVGDGSMIGAGPQDPPDAREMTDEEQLAELARRFPPLGRRRGGRR